MKKRRLSAGLAVLVAASVMAAAAPHAWADSSTTSGTNYKVGLTEAKKGDDPVSLNTTTFDKYLVMDVGANVPNATMTFTISKFDAEKNEGDVVVAASGGSLAVLNGVVGSTEGKKVVFVANQTQTGSDVAGEVKFTHGDTTIKEGETGASDKVAWADDTEGNEKYVAKIVTIDFSKAQFTAPGVYRYLISETGDNLGITNDSGLDVSGGHRGYRTLDVYVEDYGEFYNALEDKTGYTAPDGKELFISHYIMYSGKRAGSPSALNDNNKSSSYTNKYESYDMTIDKTVTGNQGSKDKYFKFAVKLDNVVPGTVYNVSYADDGDDHTRDGNADKNIPANPNASTTCITTAVTQPDTFTVAEGETSVVQVFYLQHGQSIVISGIADGTMCYIAEDPEDYSPSAKISTNGATAATGVLSDNTIILPSDTTAFTGKMVSSEAEGINGDKVVSFINSRTGTIPTGVVVSVAAPAVIGIGAIGGVIYLAVRRKKENEEE